MRKTILFTEELVNKSGITLKHPVNKDGTYTKYAQIALIVAQNGPISKRDVMKKLGHDMTANIGVVFKEECPNRHCGSFAALSTAKIIDYDPAARKWSNGINYYLFVHLILDLTAKIWDGINDEID